MLKCKRTHMLAAPLLGLLLVVSQVWAGSLIWSGSVNTCTVINCNATPIFGVYMADQAGEQDPFTTQVWAAEGICLRLDMVGSNEPDQDVKMVLVAPDGKVYRDDDRAPGLHLPLIEVAQTPITGWYTLQVYRFNGRLANGDHRLFTLLYGLYNAENPNCNDLPTRDL